MNEHAGLGECLPFTTTTISVVTHAVVFLPTGRPSGDKSQVPGEVSEVSLGHGSLRHLWGLPEAAGGSSALSQARASGKGHVIGILQHNTSNAHTGLLCETLHLLVRVLSRHHKVPQGQTVQVNGSILQMLEQFTLNAGLART